MLLIDGSGLLLLLLTDIDVVAYETSSLFLKSDTLCILVVVGDGNVDRDDGVSGAALEPASDGSYCDVDDVEATD